MLATSNIKTIIDAANTIEQLRESFSHTKAVLIAHAGSAIAERLVRMYELATASGNDVSFERWLDSCFGYHETGQVNIFHSDQELHGIYNDVNRAFLWVNNYPTWQSLVAKKVNQELVQQNYTRGIHCNLAATAVIGL